MQYDLTRPNTGRVFDYWLGGNHNFQVDRQFGDQIAKQFPVVQDQVRNERNKVKDWVQFFYARGIRAIIDFGSSLPTCDNTHIVAHKIDPSIKVVYCDIDPITTAYSKEILRGQTNVIFLQGDASQPLAVLDAPATISFLGNNRLVGFHFLSLAHILTDDQVRTSWQTLYDWAAPGSYLAVTTPNDVWNREPYLAQITESYRRAGMPGYHRSREQLMALIPPWQLTDEGIINGAHVTIPTDNSAKEVIATYSMMLYKP